MESLNKAFISIETTGLNSSNDKIIEKDIDKNISNIIGYSNEELKKYPKITEISDSFINFINSSTLVGHNNDFIFGFLNKELNVEISNEKIDVFEIAKKNIQMKIIQLIV